ncbi:hypothetical protein [Tepiditoga spiralis]|uniref:hypothetical protein n=1 Tax=Tepiditoga spiralis TaxID=2108365 RepID=UPI001684649B|nr:hypothetical protein [Tepiditoga spiralis]
MLYTLYGYYDVSIPPITNEDKIEVSYKNNLFYINYKGNEVSCKLNELNDTFSKLLNRSLKSLIIIPDRSYITKNDATSTVSFELWNKKMKIPLLVNNIKYDYFLYPPLGKRLVHVPDRWINLKILGIKDTIKLNGKKLIAPLNLNIPPSIINIEYGMVNQKIDLTDYSSNTYVLNLQKQNLYKSINTKILNVFNLNSGIFLYGIPNSLWISNGEVKLTEDKFYCNYGELKNISGNVIFAYEKDNTVYIISSSGKFFTLGTKNISKDFGRSPLSIKVYKNYIEIKTFKLETYRVNFDGGIYKEGNVYNLFLDIPDTKPKKSYETNKYIVEINDNKVFIYKKNIN